MNIKKISKNATKAIFLALLTFSSYAECSTNNLDKLFSLLAKRSSYLESVSAYKYINHENIYDASQELKVLQTSKQLAAKLKLPEQQVLIYVQIQMDYAKQIEAYWFSYWQTNPGKRPQQSSLNSLNTLREAIKQTDQQIYPLLASNSANLSSCQESIVYSHFTNALAGIKGIPTDPDYLKVYFESLKQIHN